MISRNGTVLQDNNCLYVPRRGSPSLVLTSIKIIKSTCKKREQGLEQSEALLQNPLPCSRGAHIFSDASRIGGRPPRHVAGPAVSSSGCSLVVAPAHSAAGPFALLLGAGYRRGALRVAVAVSLGSLVVRSFGSSLGCSCCR